MTAETGLHVHREVEIAGAGLAGLVAAINLARSGYAVTVYEEHPVVGRRFSGDFQGLENWSSEEDVTELLKRFGVAGGEFICRPCHEVVAFDARSNRTVIRSERPLFYLVQRGVCDGCLDRALLNAALEAGVRVIFNRRTDRLEEGGIVSVGPRAADIIAKGVVFDTTMPDTAAAILDDRLAPKGYAYLLVHDGKGTLATCMFRDFRKEKECFERSREAFIKYFPALDMADEKEFGGYGNFFFGKPAFENGRYYVGESAGLQDCLWGFGMRYAMTSGWLAARAIVEGRDYACMLEEHLLPMQQTSLVNRMLYERLGNRGYARFIDSLSRDTIEKVRTHYRPSLVKRLLYPVARTRYKSRLVDKGCHEPDCTCVWCRCGRQAQDAEQVRCAYTIE